MLANVEDERIGRRDVCQCELTCKSWKQAAQTIVFSHISIVREKDAKKPPKLIKTAIEGSQLEKMTRTLSYNVKADLLASDPYEHYYSYMQPLLKILPFLKKINTCNTTYAFYNILIMEHSHLKYMEEYIERPMDNDEIDAYVDCTLIYKNSLTSLHLRDSVVHDELSNFDSTF